MPKYANTKPPVGETVVAAMTVFGANHSKVSIIRYLATHPEGATSGQIARDLALAYHTVFRHLGSLEEEGVVIPDTPVENRQGHRVTYTLDPAELQKQLDVISNFLTGN